MNIETEEYMDIERRRDIAETAARLRKRFLRYKEAEVVYSIQHKKLIELADNAGAIYRIDGYVLINREIFDAYLENFHQEPGTYSQNAGREKKSLEKRRNV